MKRHIAYAFIFALLVGAFGMFYRAQAPRLPVQRGVAQAEAGHPLTSPEGADLYYKLDRENQELLVRLVTGFCSVKYHAPSCIHYLVKCGRPCLADLTQAEQLRALRDYKIARRQAGIPPMSRDGL